MTAFPWSLPTGLTMAGVVAAAASLLLGSRRRAAEHHATAQERAALALQRRNAWQRRLAVMALGIGCLMMGILAGIAAWLSFGAQREYAHAHNGGDWEAATGFALLLDAGALSLSLVRLFEALTLRSSALTRILLFAFVSASAAMNLLHVPGAGAGSAFLAVVPPLVYAILLEMLLYKIEQVLMGRQKRRKADRDRGYSLLLWLPWPIGAPIQMWKAWRSELLSTIDNVRVIGSPRSRPSAASPEAAVSLERIAPTTAPEAATTDPALVVNALAAGTPHTTHEEALASTETPTAASASAPASPPPSDRQPAAKHSPVAMPRPAATPEPEAKPAPEHDPVELATKGASAGQPDEKPLAPHGEAVHEGERQEEEPAGEKRSSAQDISRKDEQGQEPRELRIDIDLSVLPKNLTHRQRAERIYIAHQAAGVALSQVDLGKWAGYKNPNSGGNEYRRLEREHGPIVVREGATHVDLNWTLEPAAA